MTVIFKKFKGSYINIITKSMRGAETRGSHKYVGPIIVEGILLDEDDEFFYLGPAETEINEAVRKEEVVRMFVPIDDMMDKVFGSMGDPEDKDIN